jgi:PAS domain S-box-containing protein
MALVNARGMDTGRFVRVNRALADMLGYTREELLDRDVMAITHPDDLELDLEEFQRLLSGERNSYEIEKRLLRADGQPVWILLHASLIRDADGVPLYTVGQIVNISPFRRAVRRLSSVIDTALDAIVTTDADGNIIEFNPAAERLFGLTEADAVGSTVDVIVPPERREALGRLLRGQDPEWLGRRMEMDASDVAGQRFPVELVITRIQDDPPMFSGFIRDMRDFAERMRAERERAELESRLHQAQRLETVGQLAGGVAHDFNNLLSVIEGFADVVEGEVGDRPSALEGIGEIRRAAERAASLTRQLLTFSRRDRARPEVVDLREVVAGVRDLLARTLGKDVELDIELPSRPAYVTVDAHQFEQVLLNLALNARHAMPEGGRLSIAVDIPAGDRVELLVTDTGKGMAPEVMARAFDPFYTTKPAGEGTGLGLAVVYGIVTEAGGEVRLDSAPGSGTRALVELPQSPGGQERAVIARALDAQPAEGQTILLVDDEPGVRAMVARILRRHGYEVVEASGAEEALSAFRKLEPLPDLVLTDVAMPRMSGVELAARLGRSSPPVVFMSGYTDASVDNPDVVAHSAGFLHKPFSAAALLHRVGEALGGGAERVV